MLKEMFKVSELKRALRSGKWMEDEKERERLLEEVRRIEEPLMRDIMGFAKPHKTAFADHRATQGDAFLELAALGAIGADWLLSDKYVDDALCDEIIAAIEYKGGALKYSHRTAAEQAALLLIELSILSKDADYIPYILGAYHSSGFGFTRWYFTRLWQLIDDERVVDFLIERLDDWMREEVIEGNRRYSKPGPALLAAELLLLHGEERGIAALVPAVLNPKKGSYPGPWLFKRAYALFQKQEQLSELFQIPIAKGGQLALLSKYLIKGLEMEDTECRIRAAVALAEIGEEETLQTQAIPMLLDLLARPPGFLGSLGSDQRNIASEKALEEIESHWTPAPFLEALRHEDRHVRLFAIKALGKIGDSNTIVALNTLLEDDDRKIKKEAKKAIRKIQQ
jgi:hypothetical protein